LLESALKVVSIFSDGSNLPAHSNRKVVEGTARQNGRESLVGIYPYMSKLPIKSVATTFLHLPEKILSDDVPLIISMAASEINC
jgi:hypothetical protein